MKFPSLKLPSIRLTATIGMTTCLCLLCFAIYLQTAYGLEPCPLCVIQRVLIFFIGIIFMLSALHVPQKIWRIVQNAAIIFFSFFGMLAASRQVSLEHLPPDQVPPCGPAIETILKNLPFNEALSQIFAGSADCAKVAWRFLDMSIPSWTLLFFIAFAVMALLQAMREE